MTLQKASDDKLYPMLADYTGAKNQQWRVEITGWGKQWFNVRSVENSSKTLQTTTTMFVIAENWVNNKAVYWYFNFRRVLDGVPVY